MYYFSHLIILLGLVRGLQQQNVTAATTLGTTMPFTANTNLFPEFTVSIFNYTNPCDSNPCKDFGTCIDSQFYGYFECTCADGFSKVNNTFCIDIDECRSNALICGNFLCHNERGGYSCICGPNYAATDCSIVRTMNVTFPTFEYLSGYKVILAGGTRLILGGTNLNFYPSLGVILATFDLKPTILYSKVITDHNDSTCLDFLMPPAPSPDYLNKVLGVYVQYFRNNITITSKDYIYTGYNVTYVENPTLEIIFPTTLLADGGVVIYGKGNGFDVITNILLFVYLKISSNYYQSYQNDYNETCTSLNATIIQCTLPNLNATQMVSSPVIYQSAHRKRRAVGISDRPVSSQEQNNQNIELYMGFTFDNYQHYRRLGNSNPNINLDLVFKNPTFKADKDLRIIKKSEDLKISGEDVDVGCTKIDYKVNIASDLCDVTAISSNLLNCDPPANQSISSNDSLCTQWPDSLPIYIKLGRNTAVYFIGCAKYETIFFTTEVIIGLAVGLSILFIIILILIIACCICCIKRKDRMKKGSSPVVKYEGRMNPGYSRTIDADTLENGANNKPDASGYQTANVIGFSNPDNSGNNKDNSYLQLKNDVDYLKSSNKSKTADDDLYLSTGDNHGTSSNKNNSNKPQYLPMDQNSKKYNEQIRDDNLYIM